MHRARPVKMAHRPMLEVSVVCFMATQFSEGRATQREVLVTGKSRGVLDFVTTNRL